MKTIRRIVTVGAVLAATLLGQQAEACGIGFQLYLPFFSIGFGLGLPCCAFTCGCPAPVYCGSYAAPYASYAPPPAAPVNDEPMEMPPPARWMPSTPGAGHWVPDPQPYHYYGGPAVTQSATPTVTVAKTLGGVPVYIVQAGP